MMEPKVTNLRIFRIDRHGQETKSNPHEMCIEVVIDGYEKHIKKLPLAPTISEFVKLSADFSELIRLGSVNQRKVIK